MHRFVAASDFNARGTTVSPSGEAFFANRPRVMPPHQGTRGRFVRDDDQGAFTDDGRTTR